MPKKTIDKKDIDSLKEELEIDKTAQQVTHVNILFMDISSTSTGYSIMSVDLNNKKATLTKAGNFWFDPAWSHQEKYSYMLHAVSTYFWIVEKIDHIIVEAYSVNPNKMMGVNVVSEMQGVVKAAAWENGVKVNSILPQTWRSQLGIKAKTVPGKDGKKKRDYKEPTKSKVLQYTQVPEKVMSNITNNERQTPSDVYDSIAIGLGWLKKFGITKVDTKNVEYNSHIGTMPQTMEA